MKEELQIIHEVKECPMCHSEETVSRKGVKMVNPSMPDDTFTHLEMTIIPVSTPAFNGAPVKGICVHYDICARNGCGFRYATRSEIVTIPGQPMKMAWPTGLPQIRSN